jgi:hypothetical protein
VPRCGHEVELRCHAWSAEGGPQCPQPCEREFTECGHRCTLLCGVPCAERCLVVVERRIEGCPREHSAPMQCGDRASDIGPCAEVCGAKLACGHERSAICSDCSALPASADGSDAAHAPCRHACGRRLLCGHDCGTRHPCSEPCPPCVRPCETRCEHSKCDKVCSAPCEPCVEPCNIRCLHYACNELCGVPCTRARCDLACARELPCGHACIGLCGEPCPTVCRVCDAAYTDQITLEPLGESAVDERFVQLQDCPHTFEVCGLDNWMATQNVASMRRAGGGDDGDGESRAVQLPMCPSCRAPVRRSFRYGAVVRRCAIQIEEIKQRMYVGLEGRMALLQRLEHALHRRGARQAAETVGKLLLELAGRARIAPTAPVVQLMLGELKLRRAALLPAEAAGAAEASTLRTAAEAHLERALELVGFTTTGTPIALPVAGGGSALTLSPRQGAVVAHIALVQLGLALARREGMVQAARMRLEAAKAIELSAGIEVPLDVDSALRDVDAAEAALVAAATRSMSTQATWHECPRGHRCAAAAARAAAVAAALSL